MTRLTARADRRLIRANHRSQRFVLVELTAPLADRQDDRKRPPVNLAFVIDRSGSMSGEKIHLAKRAVEDALARLDDQDRFSVIAYDDVVEVVVESTAASAEARRNAVDRLRSVDARGSTDLGAGWLQGCDQVARHLDAEGVNRVLLLTDGLANRGITDPDELTRHATELRSRGVATSTFGLGADFDEQLLESMATAGGGTFYYIAHAAQIADHISSEVGETLDVVARGAELEVLAGEGIGVETISPHPLTSRGTRSIVALGDLVSEQVVEVVLRLTFPTGVAGSEIGLIIAVRDQDGALERAGLGDARLAWTWADGQSNDEQPRDVGVDRAVARQFAGRARQTAGLSNKQHDYKTAQLKLRRTAARIRRYAGQDPELGELAMVLEQDAGKYAAPMSAPSLKMAYFESTNVRFKRDHLGRATKDVPPGP